ncbi:MAG: hypothetical protein AAFW97_16135 [Pseudomonadota bacterium]
MTDDREHISKTDARAGRTPHMTRVILIVSLLLIVVVFAILFWGGL